MLIDILGKYKVKATFFVVGDWVDKYPESVKALHDAGHEVMNHSNTHAHMSQLSKDEIIADVEACNDKIEAVTGVRPTLIRPPYGEYDDNVITAIRSIGMEPIQWDVDSLDWKDLEAPEIIKRVTGKVQSGSIVLFHNAALHTPEALPTIIETLLQEGYTFVPISEIILPQPYTIDHTGRQLPADAQASYHEETAGCCIYSSRRFPHFLLYAGTGCDPAVLFTQVKGPGGRITSNRIFSAYIAASDGRSPNTGRYFLGDRC